MYLPMLERSFTVNKVSAFWMITLWERGFMCYEFPLSFNVFQLFMHCYGLRLGRFL
jgi:hypothetical protein